MEALKQRVIEVLGLNMFVSKDETVFIHNDEERKYHRITIITFDGYNTTKMVFTYVGEELAFIEGDQIHYSKCKKMEMLFEEETE